MNLVLVRKLTGGVNEKSSVMVFIKVFVMNNFYGN